MASINTEEPHDPNAIPTGNPEDFLERIIEFPDGTRFKRLEAITDFRKDPGEARILYKCRRMDPTSPNPNEEILVMKVKAQWPGPQEIMHEGPSPTTWTELKCLTTFRDQNVEGVPHLVTWKKAVQPFQGVYPAGYLIYTIMTLMPGRTLWDIPFWGMTEDERQSICGIFMTKLKEIRSLGFAPYDCALRNVLWDEERKKLSIVDFERVEEATSEIEDETAEFQRWGLVKRPPSRTWFQEWGLKRM